MRRAAASLAQMDTSMCTTGVLDEMKFGEGFLLDEENALTIAAANGDITAMEAARNSGCEWSCALANACGNGHLDCVKWAVEHGCPWQDSHVPECGACGAAAGNGHLDILQYIWQHGYPIGIETLHQAIVSQRLDILQWMAYREEKLFRGEFEDDDEECFLYHLGDYGTPEVVIWCFRNMAIRESDFSREVLCKALVAAIMENVKARRRREEDVAARKLQWAWRKSYYVPAYKACRRRLKRQWTCISSS